MNKMKQEDLILLTQIFNTLTLVSTKGEDTMIMGDCLRAFKDFLMRQEGQKFEEE